jgi:hypothetical protein
MGKSYVFIKQKDLNSLFNTESFLTHYSVINTKYYDIGNLIFRLFHGITFSLSYLDIDIISTKLNNNDRIFYLFELDENYIYNDIKEIPFEYIYYIKKYCCKYIKNTFDINFPSKPIEINDGEIKNLQNKLEKYRVFIKNKRKENNSKLTNFELKPNNYKENQFI